ncbi:hypothetical protein WJX77_008825 [Trebouxia sp. C0004]
MTAIKMHFTHQGPVRKAKPDQLAILAQQGPLMAHQLQQLRNPPAGAVGCVRHLRSQLSLQRIKPNSCPHIAAWRRINMSHRPVSVQLLAELSPKDATVFDLVTDAASQTTAKSMSVSSGEAYNTSRGTLAEEYTEG